jgi:hypothetical protein
LCSYSFQNFQNSTWIFLFCRHWSGVVLI